MESHYHYPTPPSFALPNPAPISMTGNHGAAFAPVADMTSLYPPTSYLFPSAFAPHCITEPTNAPVNTPLLTGYSSRAVPDSTNRAGCPPFVHQRQTDCNIQEPPATVDESVSNVVAPRLYDNIIYRKTRRPPAAYSPDIQAVAESCRADGGEEHAIALLPDIFPREVSERALTRKMTREEARKHRHHQSGASTPVYRMLLRSDDAGRSHCRLCAVGANQNGWKNAKDVLRHLKRDHFGLVHVCPRCGKSAYTIGEMSRHRCEVATDPSIAHG